MFESTNLGFDFIDELNKQGKILVPSYWNKVNFERQGVTVPVKVLPLFADPIFNPLNKTFSDLFVFGTVNGEPRKRIDRIISCFRQAFPTNKDVRLVIKINPTDNKFANVDNRINIINQTLTENDMVKLYNMFDVYVSAVSAEGWGFCQIEAMSCGVPVIATKYAGLEEFLNENNGFCLPHKEVPSTGYWTVPGGKWSDFSNDDMVEAMRVCYNNRDILKSKGLLAVEKAKEFSLERFFNSLMDHLGQPCFVE
jgi:glycosyltransferase involved in cell wall biosynthesis